MAIRRRSALAFWGALILALGSGCGSVPGQFAFLGSQRLHDGRLQISRLAVFANVTGEPFSDSMFKVLQTSMEQGFARCDVKSIVVPDPMPQGSYLGESVERFGPTHALYINRRRDNAKFNVTVDEYGYVHDVTVINRTFFKLTFLDLETRTTLWMAEAEMKVESKTPASFGADLAHIIKARLRNDRVLQTCR